MQPPPGPLTMRGGETPGAGWARQAAENKSKTEQAVPIKRNDSSFAFPKQCGTTAARWPGRDCNLQPRDAIGFLFKGREIGAASID